jgi:hypothetical protein
LDNSTLTEQSGSEDEGEEVEERSPRPLHRVELIPLSVATNQKKQGDRRVATSEEDQEFHVSDFHSDQEQDEAEATES